MLLFIVLRDYSGALRMKARNTFQLLLQTKKNIYELVSTDEKKDIYEFVSTDKKNIHKLMFVFDMKVRIHKHRIR